MSKTQGWFRLRGKRPDGTEWEEWVPNSATVEGRNHALNVVFGSTAKAGTWYFGLIDDESFSAISTSDTAASHSGWTENTDYTSGTRPSWVEGTASAASITSSSVTTFTMSANATIRGMGLFSDSQKGGTNGVIWCLSLFATSRTFSSGESWEVTSYTVSLGA